VNMKNWTYVKDENPFLKVYVHKKTGNIKVLYPTAPAWAQKVALAIYRDVETNELPTPKGVKNIVRGLWAKMISDAKRRSR
jgi:hypothetical protein